MTARPGVTTTFVIRLFIGVGVFIGLLILTAKLPDNDIRDIWIVGLALGIAGLVWWLYGRRKPPPPPPES